MTDDRHERRQMGIETKLSNDRKSESAFDAFSSPSRT
jgi:hypothetical protein